MNAAALFVFFRNEFEYLRLNCLKLQFSLWENSHTVDYLFNARTLKKELWAWGGVNYNIVNQWALILTKYFKLVRGWAFIIKEVLKRWI